MLGRLRKAQDEREGGFTLIELLVVIIIIGILAAIAIPVFLRQREKGYKAAMKSDLKNMATAEESFATDNDGSYTIDVADLELEGFNKSAQTINHTAKLIGTTGFCLQVEHAKLTDPGNVWSYNSEGVDAGKPVNAACA